MRGTMHGECKPTGGQLVTADIEVAGGRLAVTRASGWREHDWRFIREEPQEPALHMALDEVLAREVAAGRRPPTLRIWEWSAPAVVIGSFQSLRNEVDLAAARRLGLTVVRRVTGGGAMFIDPVSTITYSLYAPESLVAGMSIAESYRYLDDWVIGTLTGDLGVSAWYRPLNDIASAQGKIGGAAQKRLAGGTVLHHVTMAYGIDADAMTRVLRIGGERLSDKGIPSAAKRVDPLRRQTRLSRAEVIDALAGHFRRRYGLTPAPSPAVNCAPPGSWPGRSSPAASGRPGCHDDTGLQSPDLVWLSAALPGGVIAQAVAGGVVVLTRLNPVIVAAHFLLSSAILAAAVVLHARTGEGPGPRGPWSGPTCGSSPGSWPRPPG